MALIGINRADNLPDDCTIVIHKPAVPDVRVPAHIMLDQAELLADALEKYLPALTLTRLEQILTRKRQPKSASEPVTGWSLLRDHEARAASASADRGYDTLSCGHVVTRFAIEGGAQVPCVLAATPSDLAWCGWHGWIRVDVKQYRELVREIREATGFGDVLPCGCFFDVTLKNTLKAEPVRQAWCDTHGWLEIDPELYRKLVQKRKRR